jgi:hypothetical protein
LRNRSALPSFALRQLTRDLREITPGRKRSAMLFCKSAALGCDRWEEPRPLSNSASPVPALLPRETFSGRG